MEFYAIKRILCGCPSCVETAWLGKPSDFRHLLGVFGYVTQPKRLLFKQKETASHIAAALCSSLHPRSQPSDTFEIVPVIWESDASGIIVA